jgi:hypothetical protein
MRLLGMAACAAATLARVLVQQIEKNGHGRRSGPLGVSPKIGAIEAGEKAALETAAFERREADFEKNININKYTYYV